MTSPYESTTNSTSTEPPKQGWGFWPTAPTVDINVEDVLGVGNVARIVTVAHGGTLMVTFSVGNPRPMYVADGGCLWGVKHIAASGSTAHGINLYE